MANEMSTHVKAELDKGLRLLHKSRNNISIFGSHITVPEDKYYTHAEHLAYELGKKGHTIITGGGPGIMHAANSGAMRAGAHSIGFKASLIEKEQSSQGVFTAELSFKYLFVRRFVLAINSDALIFYPGGYGTLNEMFEYLVLIQTGMCDPVPIMCVGKSYWKGLLEWFEKQPEKYGYITKDNIKMLQLVDSYEEIISIIDKR